MNNYQQNINRSICVQQTSFKAWEADSVLQDHFNNVNMLNNFKSQLANYEKKYNRQNSKQRVKLKLPSLTKINKVASGVSKSNLQGRGQTMTCRPTHEPQQKQKQKSVLRTNRNHSNTNQNKSIQLKKYSSKALKSKQYNPLTNRQNRQNNSSNYLIKIHEMKFQHNNTKKMKKRDIYLSIFGQKNRNKVQKFIPDQNYNYNDKQNANIQSIKSNALKIKAKTQKTIQY